MGWGKLLGGGIKERGEKTHGHGQQCGDCWGVGGQGYTGTKW